MRVFLVDLEPTAVPTLRRLIHEHPRVRLVGKGGPGRPWEARLLVENPDVVVVRVDRDEQAVQLCRELRSRRPSLVCLLVSSRDVDEGAFGALLIDACDLASTEVPSHGRSEPVLRVTPGARQVSRRLDECPPPERADVDDHPLSGLTAQQQRIAHAVADGLTNFQIAGQLHLSPHTVRNHLSRIMKHLGANNRTEVAVAITRLTSHDPRRS